jgi:hypothetical protein
MKKGDDMTAQKYQNNRSGDCSKITEGASIADLNKLVHVSIYKIN